MNWRRFSALGGGFGFLVAIALFPAVAMAQSADSDGWMSPKTSWGDPDLQGIWTNTTTTPLERPDD